MPDSKRTQFVPLSLELKDDAVALAVARAIAEKAGKTIRVSDDQGNEVGKATPTPRH